MSDKRPIGVFDSGVGGITVLKELHALMGNENYIYLGDSLNAPYGSKSVDEIKKLTVKNVEKLMSLGAKACVIACNTATSVAAAYLREKYKDFPIIGVEPALKPAVLAKENSRVVVLATPVTLKEKKFYDLMNSFKEKAEIIPMPAPLLAGMIEKGILEGEELEGYIKELFSPYENEKIDSVVLGCTHYPFIKNTIKKVLGDSVRIFDGGYGTAKETKRRIEEKSLLNESLKKGDVTFLSSKESPEEIEFYKKLFDSYIVEEKNNER